MTRGGPTTDGLFVPPFTLTDRTGRHVEFRPYDGERDAVEAMYEAFDPADRAQGIPPATAEAREGWLDVLLPGPGVLAWHEERVVGHAALVDDMAGGHELVVFVLQGYRGTGIGTALVRSLLGLARVRGLGRIWLTVQRWNHPAIAVYHKTGFELEGEEGLEIVMSCSVAGEG
ncbi:MAG TPA: GNAT family N-acetyltransferase [Gemmatimonadota bacterium]|nr:GNAT family N-acetyltransferase [Gemmatimonadota bacterium]